MKTILKIFIYILLCSNMTLAQSVKTINTDYSKIEGGKIGRDKKIFQIYNSSIDKIDNYYNTRFSYGPLKLNETGYSNEGFYFELYESDVSSDPLKFVKMRELFSYRLLYEDKGGKLFFIQELQLMRLLLLDSIAGKRYGQFLPLQTILPDCLRSSFQIVLLSSRSSYLPSPLRNM